MINVGEAFEKGLKEKGNSERPSLGQRKRTIDDGILD